MNEHRVRARRGLFAGQIACENLVSAGTRRPNRVRLPFLLLVAAIAGCVLAPAGAYADTAGGFTVTGGAAGVDYEFRDGTLHILSSTPLVISTAAQTSDNIEIDAGVAADLALAGVDIATPANGTTSPINLVNNVMGTASGARATHADQIIRKTMLYLTIADGTTNKLSCLNTAQQGKGSPGIRCGWGSVLVIDDALRNLDVNNKNVEPVNGVTGSTVTLSNGTVVEAGSPLSALESTNPGELIVSGGGNSAGIGGGANENSGTLIINGGHLEVTGCQVSGSGNYSPGSGAAIGGGNGGSGTRIVFNGGHTVARASYHGAAIGCGWGWWKDLSHYGPKDDAIAIPEYSGVPAYGNYDGYSFFNTSKSQYDTVAGDISINGGYVEAIGNSHGNAFGSACQGTTSSNRNHIIKVTGGTLLPTSQSGYYDMGGGKTAMSLSPAAP